MLEVEKKFVLTPEQEKRLLEGAEFLGEKTFTDTYYDDAHYSLTTKDIWLRARDGKFELKLPMNAAIEQRVSDQYREITDEQEIAEYFHGDPAKIYQPFCTIATARKKYKKEGFGIDLDVVDFGYTIAEIELTAEDGASAQELTNKIMEFAKRHDIVSAAVKYGKVVEYLRRNRSAHFEALIKDKVLS